ncbi:type II toxin-antitoxin system Phd/YefM family antitoxin [Paludibacterium paludis]|uniref:Antitoxin n=1 Tax=Paludibacterium paludis TaxID=1225769 RepID=A0A918P5Y4_9NEIS|nr:type II toxin-antitoxin system prevent-host-death family antitoxin [Paludibacterium paludis]GGY28367.1 antitoxin [Paludibacterium paludis]
METVIGAGAFKARCLQLLDDVAATREPIVITKHGKAVAKVVPIPPAAELFGALKGSVLLDADIVAPLENDWEAAR